ncbi:MAG: ATP-binding protein [Immundisolibacter sp.]|uniref:AlbA family DNA-binding domain-containing protein n=1 Tax=Immundisolibacter sp. TaxID=1934948 RepID=UPI0019A120E8|nr:ATP-binding protein [Immundisolibacter sp.]MBC7163213.1 ATP-binding protein [Immundisolibacter sp.]
MQGYSPFDKPLRDLQSADLKALKQASEGWYIEYKRETPNAVAIAKSLSAFANTYGGWLFLGVQEESKVNPVAGEFPGLPRDEVDSSLQRLRKSAVDHLNPTPHFETKVLWGPDSEVGLAEGRAVICAWIPQSSSAPHIHRTGQIYRRVSDASEPKAENDRFVLDQLWRRGDDIKHTHKDWYDRDPEFSTQEKSQPYVRLMLIADRWAERGLWIDVHDDQVRAALGEPGEVIGIPFDTVHTSSDGFIGRQLKGNDPQNLTLTWRLRRSLVSDVFIPLPLFQPDHRALLAQDLDGYMHTQRFIDLLGRYNTNALRIVDLNYVFSVLIGVAEIQERLCKLAGWSESYHLKVKLLNCWRTIPYIDVADVLDRFETYGPPMCLDSVAAFPRLPGPEDYLEIFRHPEVESSVGRVFSQAVAMFWPLALLYGVPTWEEDKPVAAYHEALQQAGRRAIDVQHRRNVRARK